MSEPIFFSKLAMEFQEYFAERGASLAYSAGLVGGIERIVKQAEQGIKRNKKKLTEKENRLIDQAVKEELGEDGEPLANFLKLQDWRRIQKREFTVNKSRNFIAGALIEASKDGDDRENALSPVWIDLGIALAEQVIKCVKDRRSGVDSLRLAGARGVLDRQRLRLMIRKQFPDAKPRFRKNFQESLIRKGRNLSQAEFDGLDAEIHSTLPVLP